MTSFYFTCEAKTAYTHQSRPPTSKLVHLRVEDTPIPQLLGVCQDHKAAGLHDTCHLTYSGPQDGGGQLVEEVDAVDDVEAGVWSIDLLSRGLDCVWGGNDLDACGLTGGYISMRVLEDNLRLHSADGQVLLLFSPDSTSCLNQERHL